MLGRGFFSPFDDDPFFSGHRRHMQGVQSMFNDSFFQPFNPMDRNPAAAITNGEVRRGVAASRQLAPIDMFSQMDSMIGNMHSQMNNMMGNMQRQFHQVQNDPNSHCYTQSTVMSYSNVPGQNGQPQIYQATSSTRTAPGGIKETQRSVRDSRRGIDKMAIGHHIGDRGHVVERSRDRNARTENENQEYINIDEEDLPRFRSEWDEKTRPMNHHRSLQDRRDRRNREENHRHRRQDRQHRGAIEDASRDRE
ncbi:myeloid leukemia factor 1-like [Tubulanus polymorphus]|uniref:myeloid leukemia factor 1-like n=1 Tax=Tubulanus polymorphus TaxID=672921 RepID=UPI003DA3F550